MSVGYAILVETLGINGEVVVRAPRDIRIMAIDNVSTNCGFDIFHPKYTEDTIIVNIDIPSLDCTMEYDVKVVNSGLSHMQLKDVIYEGNNNDIEFIILNMDIDDVINAGEEFNIQIKFRYRESLTVLPSKTDLSIIISFVFEEYTSGPIVFLGGLAKHVVDLGASATSGVFNEPPTDFRYQGWNSNNFVMFNNELWRIIGVFSDNTHGRTGERLVKIVKETSIGSHSYDSANGSVWSTSSLFDLLNTSYYSQIDPTSRDMIREVDWNYNPFSGSGLTSQAFYDLERLGNNIVRANIGIIHPSDYGFSTPASTCPRTTSLTNHTITGCFDEAWIQANPGNAGWFWTVMGLGFAGPSAFYIGTGGVFGAQAFFPLSTFPVLYLNSNVSIISGSGTRTTPYIIGLDS